MVKIPVMKVVEKMSVEAVEAVAVKLRTRQLNS